MKNIKILGLLAVSTLMLAGCGESSSSSSSSSSSESTTSQSSASSSSSSTSYASGSGTSDSWPAAAVAEFKSAFSVTLSIPVPSSGSGWTWQYAAEEDTTEGKYYGAMTLTCADSGTAGTDAIEDTYKAQCVSAGLTVDESGYESYGYFAYSDAEMSEYLQFYTYDGTFVLYVIGNYLS